ncbi:MAG: hypothetical protein Q3971_06590 [Moraxella sp.]|nr:hypothetical protein [Moraxella sp.]
MKPMIKLASLFILAISTPFAHADNVAGYDFDDYAVKVYQGKKAPLKLGDWRMFRTRLNQTHADGKIDFGGNYMVSMWGCGTSCISGAMIDKRTGMVYGLPIGEGVPYDFGCVHEFDNPLENEPVVFLPNSRLFVARNCESEQVGNSNQYLEKYTFNMYLWQEKTKAFKLIKKVHKTQTTTHDW